MNPRLGTVILLLALPLLAACGGDDEPAADCLDATKIAPAIAGSASGAKITPVEAQAVQSESSDLYYVAMSFTIEGDDGEPATGVWITDSLEPDASAIMSVDAMAKEFTTWPDAEEVHEISYPNDNTDAAESCL
ncbi:hypothetical protein ACFV9G_13590 [Nocardioides sp. NPDC059952]|uniref:hypothetical protein n=1 Tax=Nocardioides sp. NPDC059952 TaxID=3347014 RepID=UPI003664A5DC